MAIFGVKGGSKKIFVQFSRHFMQFQKIDKKFFGTPPLSPPDPPEPIVPPRGPKLWAIIDIRVKLAQARPNMGSRCLISPKNSKK